MLDSHEYLHQTIMTSNERNPSYGLPPPITELTVEQDLKLRNVYDALHKPETRKEDMITYLMALQKQNFVLGNSLTNLVEKWQERQIQMDLITTNEDLQMFGILLEHKDWTSISAMQSSTSAEQGTKKARLKT